MLSYWANFKAPRELWNPLSKAVPSKFHGSVGHSKCNCLQNRANFHRSRAFQIALIFDTTISLRTRVQHEYINAETKFAIDILKFIFLKENFRILT